MIDPCRVFGFLLLLAAAGCRIQTVEPIPLQGPSPEAIVIAPPVDRTREARVGPEILVGLDRAVRKRGYRVLPLATGLELLREHDLERAAMLLAPGLENIKRALDADAVLTVTVHRWEPVYRDSQFIAASYDLEYALTSTVFGSRLWSYRLEGRHMEPLQEPGDPLQERNPELATVEITLGRRQRLGSAAQLLAALHDTAALHLPQR